MDPKKEKLNYLNLFKDLGNVCMTTDTCGTCLGKHCLIGYAKECAAVSRKDDIMHVQNGLSNVPYLDLKGGYDVLNTLHGIAHILTQCRSCKEHHYADCIVNIIRSCYEVIAFGEMQPFNGNIFMYLMKLQEVHPEQAAIILEEYKLTKSLQV